MDQLSNGTNCRTPLMNCSKTCCFNSYLSGHITYYCCLLFFDANELKQRVLDQLIDGCSTIGPQALPTGGSSVLKNTSGISYCDFSGPLGVLFNRTVSVGEKNKEMKILIIRIFAENTIILTLSINSYTLMFYFRVHILFINVFEWLLGLKI